MNAKWIVFVLLSIQSLLLGWLGWVSSPNLMEVSHMGATVYQWHTSRFDVFHVNPPLVRVLTGLPVALCGPKYDWSSYSGRPQDRCEGNLGADFIAANGFRMTHWCFVLARWILIPPCLLGAYCGYLLSREIYGESPAIVFLVLWCFSPTLMAWEATICPDAVSAALGLLGIYSFRRWLRGPNWKGASIAGVCLGLLPLTKTTWVIAFGIWPMLWCLWTAPMFFRTARDRSVPFPPLRQLLLILLLGLYVLNMGYLFDGTCRPLGEYVFQSPSLHGERVVEGYLRPVVTPNCFAGTWLAKIPVPLPAEFVQGIDTQRYDFERGLSSYLRGEWADRGWWYYYLYASMIKIPLGTWCLVAIALALTVFGSGFSAPWRDEMILLVPLVVMFVFVSSQTGFSAHLRYLILALPFLFVWTSKIGRAFGAFPRPRTAVVLIATAALTWGVGSSLVVYPHSLSYFNELVGGPRNGPEHLLGSNVDWGQDLLYLRRWLDEHPRAQPFYLAFQANYDASHFGIEHSPLPIQPAPGWHAISVNALYNRDGRYGHFLRFQPVATGGYSIYIYHLTLAEANRIRRELGLPELLGDPDGALRSELP